MDTNSSGEDLALKTRKPYTITKQRERWTEEEHNRFLEALKLYGRAWQRIEEHIGTKTAVQIRSHAQKFFSKLEKEALVKGIPIGQAIDIDIPPPRPKRKPSNPYPRKNGAASVPITQVGVKDVKQGITGSPHPGKQLLDLEKEPLPEKSIVEGGAEDRQDNRGNDLCSGFTIYQETSGISTADAKDSCNFTEFIPLVKNVTNKDKSSESHITDEAVPMDALQNNGTGNEMQGAKNFPRHVPVHILDGSARTCSHQALSSDVSYQESRPAANHHSPFHPFRGTQEDYASLLQMSSTFSSLVVSTLLQNPAAHAASMFAASFWPCTNSETSTDSHPKPMNPTPGMAAIAAATVAAATAWWAAHGLLPVCAPPYHHAGFTCPPPTTANTAVNVEEREENNNNIKNCSSPEQQMDQEFSEALQPPPTSSSESGDQACPKAKNVLTSSNNDHEKKNQEATKQKDSSKTKNIKPADRSSCGSNSSSEGDADALEKQEEEDKEENKEADADLEAGESSSRRSRIPSCSNDSWKEVSNMGRMAFQALFLRESLPQSFSPSHVLKNGAEQQTKKNEDQSRQKAEEMNEDRSQLDLNSNITESCSSHQEIEKKRMAEDNIIEEAAANEGLLTIGLAQGKLKARRTGFKPYKRCSMEARESRMPNTNSTQEQEKGPKRLRLGEEASS